jgi:tetratricopeptide (TPR) repeat protein
VVGAELVRESPERAGRATAVPDRVPRQGRPPLVLDTVIANVKEARDLRAAVELYERGRVREARERFTRYDSLPARVGAAYASAARERVPQLRRLAREHPRSALVRLHLGLALFWEGDSHNASAQWREALAAEPDTTLALRAEDLLFPAFVRGRPTFVPRFALPAADIAILRRRARANDVRAKLAYGVVLQQSGRHVSARRVYREAEMLAPRDVEPKVALAVANFEKATPAVAFGRLGPLVRRWPRSPTVRFHLGLLLLWSGELDEGRRQLELARAYGGRGPLGREATRFLSRLENRESAAKP